MTDQVLDILKLVLLALLYLFFARVLWAVWSDVREPANARTAGTDGATVAPVPSDERRQPKPKRGRGAVPARLTVLEPKERKGAVYAITGQIGIGRDDGNTILVVDDTFISGRHAVIALADGIVTVTDLGSRNGTYLNGTRITAPRSVNVGDRIQFGTTIVEAQ